MLFGRWVSLTRQEVNIKINRVISADAEKADSVTDVFAPKEAGLRVLF